MIPSQIEMDSNALRLLCIDAVRKEGGNLAFVPEVLRTEDICLAAVRRNGYALQDVPEVLRTDEMCLAAVQRNGCALQFVPEDLRTESICLAAVKQNGHALQFVPEDMRTPELCTVAVREVPAAILFVPEDKQKYVEEIAQLIEGVEEYGELSEIVEYVTKCPTRVHNTWSFAYLCGLAEGRMAGQMMMGQRVNVPGEQLAALQNAIAAHVAH